MNLFFEYSFSHKFHNHSSGRFENVFGLFRKQIFGLFIAQNCSDLPNTTEKNFLISYYLHKTDSQSVSQINQQMQCMCIRKHEFDTSNCQFCVEK